MTASDGFRPPPIVLLRHRHCRLRAFEMRGAKSVSSDDIRGYDKAVAIWSVNETGFVVDNSPPPLII